MSINTRLIAFNYLYNTIKNQQNFADIEAVEGMNPADRGLIKELVMGVFRFHPFFIEWMQQLLANPLHKADKIKLEIFFSLGVYQILFTRIPEYAAINETIDAVGALLPHSKKLLNALLRETLRQKNTLISRLNKLSYEKLFPEWLVKNIQKDWPQETEIFENLIKRPPLTIRVNPSYKSRDEYLIDLQAQEINAKTTFFSDIGIRIDEAISVQKLTELFKKNIYIQDEGAQLAVKFLNPLKDARILEVGAAPGGKSTHLLETGVSPSNLVLLDVSAKRLKKLKENLSYFVAMPQIICARMENLVDWWDGKEFDYVLLDAPCSATGVMRRHPEIKYLRQMADIEVLFDLQTQLLESAWQVLKVGGRLLYATCSILKSENEEVIAKFLRQHSNAQIIPLTLDSVGGEYGLQILPGWENMDGFFYSLLEKRA